MDGLRDDTVTALDSAVKTMRESLLHEMFKPLTSATYTPKLSAGFTVQDNQSSFTHQHHKYPPAQREVGSSSTDAFENLVLIWLEDWGFAMQTGLLNLPGFQRFPKNVKKPRLKFRRKAPNAMACGCAVNSDEPDYYRHASNSVIGRPLDTAHGFVQASPGGLLGDPSGDARDLGVGSRRLYELEVENGLRGIIVAKHEVMPRHVRDECPVWFRGNWGVSNPQHEFPDFLEVARSYLDPEDRKKELRHLVPEAKRKSFVLYAMLLNGNDPKACQFDTACKDLYFQFGFVTGRSSEGEQVLPKVYRSFISKCSFTEFWTAFESKNLITLMDAKGLKGARSKVQHLEVFLKIKPAIGVPLCGTSDSSLDLQI